MRDKIQPVILCGGAGTRLWPQSRGLRAKQFIPLTGSQSLFAQTLARVDDIHRFDTPLIVCGETHLAMVREQIGERPCALLVEPVPRNTATAIALAVAGAHPDRLLLVMPSDHVIADVAAFHAAIEAGAALARDEWLVAFGITPDRADTGFGYIASGQMLENGGFAVERFIEKPPLSEAERMFASGGYNWNAGIFLFRAGRMRDAMRAHCPQIYLAAERAFTKGQQREDALFAGMRDFETAPSISIDYAVMEKDERVAVVPVSMGWSDLGSWHAVHDLAGANDDAGNVIDGDAFLHDCCGNLVRTGGKRVALIGMHDVAVIVDGDDILIMPLERSQDVRVAAQAREFSAAPHRTHP